MIWRSTGRRTRSEQSERRGQRLVAASFLLLAPYFLYEAIARLINGTQAHAAARDRADGLERCADARAGVGEALRSSYGLLRDSGRVFLEAAPKGLDPDAIGKAMIAEPGVVEVRDLHVWEVTSGFPALSAHVLVQADSDCHAPPGP